MLEILGCTERRPARKALWLLAFIAREATELFCLALFFAGLAGVLAVLA